MFHEDHELAADVDRRAPLPRPVAADPDPVLGVFDTLTAERDAARAVADLLAAYHAAGLVKLPAAVELTLADYLTR